MKEIKEIIDGIINLIKGLYVTFKNAIRGPVTVQYPDEKKEISDRFRGAIVWEMDKCIACMICDKICPSHCISIATCIGEDKKRKPMNIKYDMSLCAFCGFCSEMCPTNAIYHTKKYELSVFERQELLLSKEKMIDGYR